MRQFILSAAILSLSIAIAGELQAQGATADSGAVDMSPQLAALKAEFRRFRTDPDRRADTLWRFVALGPEGIATAREVLDKELDQHAKAIAAASKTAAMDRQLDELRQVLAGLRADPDLTKEKIEATGLPALEALNRIYAQRQPIFFRDRARLDRVGQELEQFAAFLQSAKAASPTGESSTLDAYLTRAEQLAVATVDPDHAATQRIIAENAKGYKTLDPRCVEGMQGLNKMRIMFGVHPLSVDHKLCKAATGHAADMKANGFFAHESPLPGKTTFQDRARLADTTASGENIYMGRSSAYSAVKGWFLSPGHHKNMFSETHRRQGLGRSGDHWAHAFGR